MLLRFGVSFRFVKVWTEELGSGRLKKETLFRVVRTRTPGCPDRREGNGEVGGEWTVFDHRGHTGAWHRMVGQGGACLCRDQAAV